LIKNPFIGPYLGDYEQLLVQGGDFYGVFRANNTPDLANFPHGVHYQRNANFTTQTLLDVTGTTAVPISIDPFFVHISRDEEEEAAEEERAEEGSDRLRLEGLKYEKLEIKELGWRLDGDGQVSNEAKRKLRHFLTRMMEAI
jgi:hypothetical protein